MKTNNQTKSRSVPSVVIPETAWKHVSIECAKVARRFHLNDDDREELVSHIGCKVRLAVAGKYDPRRGKVTTFVQRIVHNQLVQWMRKEYRRREEFRSMAVENAQHESRRQLAEMNGQVYGVDDTTYVPNERWDHGEEVPQRQPNEDAPWDPSGERRLLTIACVRLAVERLDKGESKSILKLYLKCQTLTEVYERMRARRRKGLGTARFYGEMWPKAMRDFAREWMALKKRFVFL